MDMKPARDITITLIIKITLLVLLWFLCFKGVDKSNIPPKEWLFGSPQKQQAS